MSDFILYDEAHISEVYDILYPIFSTTEKFVTHLHEYRHSEYGRSYMQCDENVTFGDTDDMFEWLGGVEDFDYLRIRVVENMIEIIGDAKNVTAMIIVEPKE